MRLSSRRSLPTLAVIAALALTGCDADTRDDIADAVDDVVSEAEDVVSGAEDVVSEAQSVIDDVTAQPTTEETVAATEEPAPTETATVPAPSESPTAVETVGDEGGIPWPLVMALAAVLALLVWAFVVIWRRRQAVLARRARLRDAALADLDWLLGAAREQVASVDAASRARDVRLRQDRLTETLQQLRVDASDDVLAVTSTTTTTSRHLTDALIARLDDAAARRGDDSDGLGVRDLHIQLSGDRDDLARALGASPDQR